jgi:hypothetical protein
VRRRRRGRLGPKGEEERWAVIEPKNGNGRIQEIKFFQILFEIWIFWQTLEICTRIFRRNFDMGFFLKSSRLLKDF